MLQVNLINVKGINARCFKCKIELSVKRIKNLLYLGVGIYVRRDMLYVLII